MLARSPILVLVSAIIASGLIAQAEKAENSLWSLQPLRNVTVPPSDDPWARNEIDHFVLRKLREHDLSPQKEADRFTLIRRLHASLTGLPPSIDDVQTFATSKDPASYHQLVAKLLASPHYGERWARHWLDVVRFGESDGILTVNEDRVRGEAWRFRDAVIHAFNEDLPFDQFVRLHLGGASKTEPTFYVDTFKELHQFLHLGTRLQNNADPNDKQWHRLDDMVATTGTAFLGLSTGCARCHDHPVDPMGTEEYYQLAAVFFDQVKEQPKASRKPIPLAITKPQVLKAGSWRTPGEEVEPGYLKVLMEKPATHWEPEDEKNPKLKALAAWITDPEHGSGQLLARVIVNRLWHHHFGRGLVSTPNDFGSLGSPPSHPDLLDWLAAKLIENGWRLKPIHRLILTSATYRQAGSRDPAPLAQDADNVWLWQFRTRRLEAEAIRDHLLSVAGVLKTDLFGKSISIGNFREFVQDEPKSWRRSIYLQAHRSATHPTLSVFDLPNSERSIGARSNGVSPDGALFALNAPLVWQLSEHLAKRLVKEAGDDPAKQIERAYLLAFSRPPSKEEAAIGKDLLDGGDEPSLIDYCHLLLGLNEFIYIP